MKVLITGANSYAGARIYFELSNYHEVLGTYHNNSLSTSFVQLDVTSKEEIEKLVSGYKPDVIIHTANNANAKWCEAHPDEALEININSSQLIVDAANKIGSKIIYISSFSAKNPITVYGKTKYESEKIFHNTNLGYLILRPSLIIGYSPNTTNDRPFNRILKHIDTGSKAEYDTSWKFQPTYIKHITTVLLDCLKKNIINQTIAVASLGLKTRYDIAHDILAPFGIVVTPINTTDTSPVITDDLSSLQKHSLSMYSYPKVISSIVEEIRNRNQFILP